MGIAVKELLGAEYFKDFQVIAGRQGLEKEVQGITVMDAPDAFLWTKGKELVMCTGFAIMMEPDCIRKAFEEGSIKKISVLMIKKDRYLKEIPNEIVQLFDEYGVPLILMPREIPYMDVMNQINVLLMNRTIRRFRIQGNQLPGLGNTSYKEQKIRRILQAVEVEMNFPAFLYDLEEKKSYFSSANFTKITESYDLNLEDYWNPSKPYTKHVLCDYLDMTRIRLKEENEKNPRVSWIRIPIIMGGEAKAYFVIMESRDFIDYYDEYSIRIAFLMLQGVYEQVIIARTIADVGFEQFILYALEYKEKDDTKLRQQANLQRISWDSTYCQIVVRQTDERYTLRECRKAIEEQLRKEAAAQEIKLVMIEEQEALVLIHFSKSKKEEERLGNMEALCEKIAVENPQLSLEFAVNGRSASIKELSQAVQKCHQIRKMGQQFFPKQKIWNDKQLGALTWLKIPETELQHLLEDYLSLMEDKKNIELLHTLKIYLENNMNFSITAEKMFVHINTIRKRIDKISQILEVEWENPMDRLKVEILLQMLNLEK